MGKDAIYVRPRARRDWRRVTRIERALVGVLLGALLAVCAVVRQLVK